MRIRYVRERNTNMNDFDYVNSCTFEGFVSSPIINKGNKVTFSIRFPSDVYKNSYVEIDCVAYNNLALIIEATVGKDDKVYIISSCVSEPSTFFVVHKLFILQKKIQNNI